jgi:hypothetical protein
MDCGLLHSPPLLDTRSHSPALTTQPPAFPTLQDIKFNVHAHPTLSEVLDELFKGAHVDAKSPSHAAAKAKQPVAA